MCKSLSPLFPSTNEQFLSFSKILQHLIIPSLFLSCKQEQENLHSLLKRNIFKVCNIFKVPCHNAVSCVSVTGPLK